MINKWIKQTSKLYPTLEMIIFWNHLELYSSNSFEIRKHHAKILWISEPRCHQGLPERKQWCGHSRNCSYWHLRTTRFTSQATNMTSTPIEVLLSRCVRVENFEMAACIIGTLCALPGCGWSSRSLWGTRCCVHSVTNNIRWLSAAICKSPGWFVLTVIPIDYLNGS